MVVLIVTTILTTLSKESCAFTPPIKTRLSQHFHFSLAAVATDNDNAPSTEAASTATDDNNSDEDNAFNLLAGRAAVCLLQSDMRRDAVGKSVSTGRVALGYYGRRSSNLTHAASSEGKSGGTQASSATNWINDASAFALQKAFDKIELKVRDYHRVVEQMQLHVATSYT